MNTVFLSEDHGDLQRVYGDYMPQELYKKEDLIKNPERFKNVRYIFSTWGMPKLTEQEIRTCLPSLEAVFYAAGSVQSFARPFLSCGVKVFSAWAANAVPVAEYATAQIILANKGFFRCLGIKSPETRTAAKAEFNTYPGNYHTCIGIIGAGMIGKLVIKRLREYDLEIVTFDPFLPEETARELGVTKVSLQELFATCQVVSNHLANNEQTKGMLDASLFSAMLPGATFLNTGRGAQVVEADLIAALKSRPDLTAILDVTYPEPPAGDSELYTLPNCILTPHMAGSSGNEVRRMAAYMMEEYDSFTAGKPCRFEVTAKMLETMA